MSNSDNFPKELRYSKEDEWVKYFEDAVYQILARNNYVGAKNRLIAKHNLVL